MARRQATAWPAAESIGGGEIVRQRCGGKNGGHGRAGGGGCGGISAVVYSLASEEMPRAAADASHLVPRIV
jgi:hypothetical protein